MTNKYIDEVNFKLSRIAKMLTFRALSNILNLLPKSLHLLILLI